jgi:hypothetical protein
VKIEQTPKFQPITITLETNDEVTALWDAVRGEDSATMDHANIRDALSDWFANQAQLGGDK